MMIFTDEVSRALSNGLPVVALESTIISHGMPYPENVKTAQEVEAVVRSWGAVPATIAILKGQVHIGLDAPQLEFLGKAGKTCKKTSRRDISYVVSRKLNGATTVSGTAFLAAKAGIAVFVTGGIGGVHRGGEVSMDVSADLTELSQTPVAVVCAGVKSILDIGRTLEALETLGVPVYSYQTDEFPAFFSSRSGFRAPLRADAPEQLASAIVEQRALSLPGGLLVAVPVPPSDEAAGELVEGAIQQALKEADERGISGADSTPFILQRVAELSKGASLKSNIALVKNNAKVGAQIAVSLAKMKATIPRRIGPPGNEFGMQHEKVFQSVCDRQVRKGEAAPPLRITSHAPIAVIGAIATDYIARPSAGYRLLPCTSTPGQLSKSVGGVAHNIAAAIRAIGLQSCLITAVGDDEDGLRLREHLCNGGIGDDFVQVVTGASTASYHAIHDEKGDLSRAIAAMDILKTSPTEKHIMNELEAISKGREKVYVIFDGNIARAAIGALKGVFQTGRRAVVMSILEPTSFPKAKAAAELLLECKYRVTTATPNLDEAVAMATAVAPREANEFQSWLSGTRKHARWTEEDRHIIKRIGKFLCESICNELIITGGSKGVAIAQRGRADFVSALEVSEGSIVSSNGAGDAFLAGYVVGRALGAVQWNCVKLGQNAAVQVLCSSAPPDAALSELPLPSQKGKL